MAPADWSNPNSSKADRKLAASGLSGSCWYVVPDKIIGPQEGKGVLQIAGRQQTALADR
jgi:hypothetical protein